MADDGVEGRPSESVPGWKSQIPARRTPDAGSPVTEDLIEGPHEFLGVAEAGGAIFFETVSEDGLHGGRDPIVAFPR